MSQLPNEIVDKIEKCCNDIFDVYVNSRKERKTTVKEVITDSQIIEDLKKENERLQRLTIDKSEDVEDLQKHISGQNSLIKELRFDAEQRASLLNTTADRNGNLKSEIEGLKAENERLKKIINQPKDQLD